MRKYYFLSIFIFVLFAGILVFAQQNDPFGDIVYPVAELGDCQDKEACEAYCELPDNMGPCLDFAETHNLLPEEEIAIARKMLAAGETNGPGGCRGQAECDVYCDDINHLPECLAFAEEHDLMPPEELEEARKVVKALERGLTPPNNCRSKEECDIYCSQPANMRECLTFAAAADLMPAEEREEAEKVLAAIERGVTPPPCGGREACDEYCSEPEHFEECITFAEAAGFMSAEEAEMVRRTGGVGPGGCRGKEECEAFCEDPANMGPCIDFAAENGFMTPEEAEQARKMLAAGFTSGPGGCRGQEECEAYCGDIAHMTECVDFAEKAGFMSAEDAARARKMAELGVSGGPGGCKEEEECRMFCEDPANMDTCIDFAVKIGDMTQEEADQARQRLGQMEEINRKMQECLAMPCAEAFTCFQSIQQPEGEGGQPPEGGEGAPKSMTGGIEAEVQTKLEACAQEMQGQFLREGVIPEGIVPPEGEIPIYDESRGGPAPFIPQGPSQEEIDRMMEEESQRKIQQITEEEQQRIRQEEIDRMMEEEGRRIREEMESQQGAPATESPQSFFDRIKIFLAGLIF